MKNNTKSDGSIWFLSILCTICLIIAGYINYNIENENGRDAIKTEEKPEHCLFICSSLDQTEITNVQGCGDQIKEFPDMSTCANFYGEFIFDV